MVIGLAKSYGATALGPATLNMFFASHIAYLKASEIAVIAQTGQVLDGATAGFGLGYVGSTAVIAAGQLMLGNTLDAVVTVGTAMVFANPTAATCAAIGALYYGYHALSDEERANFHAKLQEGLGIGVELIKSLISFVESSLTKLLDNDSLRSLRALVAEYASMFGRSVADITKSVSDRAILIAHQATAMAYDAASTVGSKIYSGAATAGEYGEAVGVALHTAGSGSGRWLSETSRQARDRLVALFENDKGEKK
ncbi:MAG: hypothetical protein NBV60_00550 [Erythrobacter sp.]|nr:hypothetical protein [Erythrobacter sp.]